MIIKTEKTKMLTGELYRSTDSELVKDAARAQRLVAQYNATLERRMKPAWCCCAGSVVRSGTAR